MTSTEVIETNESDETPKGKAVRLEPLPDSVLNPSPLQVKTIALGPVFASKVEETNRLLDEFQAIRDAAAQADEALEKSSHEKAVEYRLLKHRTDETIEKLESESDEAKEIKRLKQIIADKVKAARGQLNTIRDEAQAIVVGDSVSHLDPDSLAKELSDLNTVLSTMKKVLQDENEGLKQWHVIDASVAKGEKGSRKSKTGTRRPRLAYAKLRDANGVVTDVEKSNPNGFVTSTDICKKIGIADVGSLNTLMYSAVGDPDQIPAKEFSFPVTVNGTDWTVIVSGRSSAEDEEQAAA